MAKYVDKESGIWDGLDPEENESTDTPTPTPTDTQENTPTRTPTKKSRKRKSTGTRTPTGTPRYSPAHYPIVGDCERKTERLQLVVKPSTKSRLADYARDHRTSSNEVVQRLLDDLLDDAGY